MRSPKGESMGSSSSLAVARDMGDCGATMLTTFGSAIRPATARQPRECRCSGLRCQGINTLSLAPLWPLVSFHRSVQLKTQPLTHIALRVYDRVPCPPPPLYEPTVHLGSTASPGDCSSIILGIFPTHKVYIFYMARRLVERCLRIKTDRDATTNTSHERRESVPLSVRSVRKRAVVLS